MKIFIVRPCLRGGEDKSLIRRDREDDPCNRTLDLFVPDTGKGKKSGDTCRTGPAIAPCHNRKTARA